MLERNWLGVICSHFLKVEQKLLSLLKPEEKAISFMGRSGVRKRYLAELIRVAMRY